MKTKNDLNQTIYVCPCCSRTWITANSYVDHLRLMVNMLEATIKDDLKDYPK